MSSCAENFKQTTYAPTTSEVTPTLTDAGGSVADEAAVASARVARSRVCARGKCGAIVQGVVSALVDVFGEAQQ